MLENHWHGKSKHLGELTIVGHFLPKLDRFRLLSALPCCQFHGSPTLLHIDLRKHIIYGVFRLPPPQFWGCGNSGAQAVLSTHALLNTAENEARSVVTHHTLQHYQLVDPSPSLLTGAVCSCPLQHLCSRSGEVLHSQLGSGSQVYLISFSQLPCDAPRTLLCYCPVLIM